MKTTGFSKMLLWVVAMDDESDPEKAAVQNW